MAEASKPGKILLICYSFPPFPGIGGRRWAKFSKYLSKDGYQLFVLGALHRNAKHSPWLKDVEGNPAIHYTPVKTRHYNFYHNYKPTFVNKVAFRISKALVESNYKGNFYDKALPSNNLFYARAKQLILKEGISTLIVTIAPNRLVEVGERLKKEFPHIQLIIDVRDPWNFCNEEWDHKYLSEARKAHEVEVERSALQLADTVFTVGDKITDHYKALFPERTAAFVTVPNGYDTEEVTITGMGSAEKHTGKKNIVFAGTLYDNVTGPFEEFVLAVNTLQKNDPEKYKDIEFHFYIHRLPAFEAIVEKHTCTAVHFHEHLPLAKIQEVIGRSYACMLFLSPNYEFSLSTKFFEYISKNKKILVCSMPGSVPDLVKEHHLGYVLTPGTVQEDLQRALNDLDNGGLQQPHTFELERYSVEHITSHIKQYLR